MQQLIRRLDRSSGTLPPVIDQPVVRNHEHPGPKVPPATLEAAEVPHEVQEHLAGQVLRLARSTGMEVTENRRCKIAIDVGSRPISAGQGRGQNLREVVSERWISRSSVVSASLGVSRTEGAPSDCHLPLIFAS
ncbi:MAG: hypothetical protein ABIR67_02420 [Gaiellaceae bacterium]